MLMCVYPHSPQGHGHIECGGACCCVVQGFGEVLAAGGELRKRSRGRSGEGCGGDKWVGVRRIHY